METIDSKNQAVEQSSGLVNHALRWGAIIGVGAIILTLVLYAVDYTYLADWKVGIFFLLVFLGLAVYSGINYRNSVGGYLSYGKAFQHGFIVLATAGLVNVLFGMVLHTVIDPDLAQNLTDATVEKTGEMLEGFGMPSDKIEEQLDKMKEDMPKRFAPAGQLISYLWGLIIYAIISAVSALIVKKNAPETF